MPGGDMRATLLWLGLLLGGSDLLHAQAQLSTQDLASVRTVAVGSTVLLERMPVAIDREAAMSMKRIDVYAADARILVSDGRGVREIPRSDWLHFVSTKSDA